MSEMGQKAGGGTYIPQESSKDWEKNLCSYILEIPKVWILLSINLTFFLNKKQSRLLPTQGY